MRSKQVGLALIGLVLVLQLLPVRRTNPPVESEIPATTEIQPILRRACYDCHSHETRWPWYAYLAPFSWLVSHDVQEARKHLNLSAWNRHTAEERAEKREEMWEEVEEGEMPLWYYLPLHPEARLSAEDKQVLREWAHQSE